MEIIELISYYIHEDTQMVEVSFRTNLDAEEEFRADVISLKETSDYGYDIIKEDFEFFDEDGDDDDEFEDFVSIDEDLLISFLNEYYIVNPNKLPEKELL
jgi:hypothetical protein